MIRIQRHQANIETPCPEALRQICPNLLDATWGGMGEQKNDRSCVADAGHVGTAYFGPAEDRFGGTQRLHHIM